VVEEREKVAGERFPANRIIQSVRLSESEESQLELPFHRSLMLIAMLLSCCSKLRMLRRGSHSHSFSER